MNIKEIFKSVHFNKLLIVLAVITVLVFVFSLGVFVGHEKYRFSRAWGENYYHNIIGRRGMMNFNRSGFNARGGFGQIIKIDGNSLIIKGQTNVEKTILTTEQTRIIKNFQTMKLSDLKIDNRIIIIGRPNDQGQIEAKLIRVMPVQTLNGDGQN